MRAVDGEFHVPRRKEWLDLSRTRLDDLLSEVDLAKVQCQLAALGLPLAVRAVDYEAGLYRARFLLLASPASSRQARGVRINGTVRHGFFAAQGILTSRGYLRDGFPREPG